MASIRVRGNQKEARLIYALLKLNGWDMLNARVTGENNVQTGATYWIYAWPPEPKDAESDQEAENGDLLELR
jgi:hypothetical protein